MFSFSSTNQDILASDHCFYLEHYLEHHEFDVINFYLEQFYKEGCWSIVTALSVLKLTFLAKKVLPARRNFYEDTQYALVDMGFDAQQVMTLLADLK